MHAVQRKHVIWLALAFSGLLLIVSACGPKPTTNSNSTPPTAPARERLYVLDGYSSSRDGNNTDQRIIGIQPEGTGYTALPAGLVPQDHQRIYTAAPQYDQSNTMVKVWNVQDNSLSRSFTIVGTYTTAGQNYTQSVISADGHWLALRQIGQTGAKSTIALVDTQAGKLVETIQLQGDFDLDALSPDGNRVYLLERLNDTVGHYLVRLYEVNVHALNQYPVADKQDINNPAMLGSAISRQVASGGKKVYTLYTDIAHNIAFIHILPVANRYTGARCIDLPVGKSANLLNYYTLALSSDGSTLYAANGALGVVSKISVTDDSAIGDQLISTAHFDPATAYITSEQKTRLLHNGVVLSPDQHTLYFIGVNGIWSVDTLALHIKNHYVTQQAFTSIASSADGNILYAVYPDQGFTVINISSGQTRLIPKSQYQAHAPWGIEWTSN